MTIKPALERYCPRCGKKLVPTTGNKVRWECGDMNCDVIDSTFDEFTGEIGRIRLRAVVR